MSNTIETSYRTGLYGSPGGSSGAAGKAAQTGRFSAMAAQMSSRGTNIPTGGCGLGTLLSSAAYNPYYNPYADLAVQKNLTLCSPASFQTEEVSETEAAGAVSLESMLKAKYPNLAYHVFDASSSDWRTRNDYPHYLLYQEGPKAAETLENWEPVGENPFYGSVDGKFIAPKEIHALGSVPPGSKAVVIHPKVQERMEEDPDYACEIMARIDAWFALDAARNEAFRPGASIGMSQAVAIGEDGNICNAQASGSGGITFSRSGSEMEDWWELRKKRHDDFIKWLAEKQIEDSAAASRQSAAAGEAQAARARLAEMLEHGNLLEILGDTVADMPTTGLLALVKSEASGERLLSSGVF